MTAQATGVLMLALRVNPEVATGALAAAAEEYGVAVEAVAAAVVTRAGGLSGGDPWLCRAVWVKWGDLLE